MSGPGRFDPSELRTPGQPDPPLVEQADALSAAREIESFVASDVIGPTEGFDDRVMAAIAAEPAPRVVVRDGTTVRGGRPAAFLLAIRDAWRVATTGGRPLAVRAQALALVLIVVLGVGALTAATAITVGGFLRGTNVPQPSVQPSPSFAPAPSGPVPSGTVAPSASPVASGSPEPTETAEPTETPEPGGTAKPTETPEASDDHGGGGSGSGSGGSGPG
jgi:hypothetical protein